MRIMLKKKKIANYLEEQKKASVFNELLHLYIKDELKPMLQEWGLTKVSLYVTWNDIEKYLDVQAKYQGYFYEWQFYKEECEYMIYIDGDEPDEAIGLRYSDIGSVDDLFLRMKTLIPVSN